MAARLGARATLEGLGSGRQSETGPPWRDGCRGRELDEPRPHPHACGRFPQLVWIPSSPLFPMQSRERCPSHAWGNGRDWAHSTFSSLGLAGTKIRQTGARRLERPETNGAKQPIAVAARKTLPTPSLPPWRWLPVPARPTLWSRTSSSCFAALAQVSSQTKAMSRTEC